MRLWRAERALARLLERGAPALDGASGLWSWAAQRRARRGAPGNARLIGVEGATLGGSWKTPASLALALALRERGLQVGFLSHGYRAAGGLRRVLASDDPAVVGDEAALAARRLAGPGIPVLTGPRDEGLRALAAEVEVIVADGLPARGGPGAASLLVLDGERPWGAGRCPPAGDLRAPPGHLLACATQVLVVGTPLAPGWQAAARHEGWPAAGSRVALVTMIARPERLLRAALAQGLEVVARVELPDHGGPGAGAEAEARLPAGGLDAVVCSEKCALWLPATLRGLPVRAVRVALDIPAGLVDSLLFPPPGR